MANINKTYEEYIKYFTNMREMQKKQILDDNWVLKFINMYNLSKQLINEDNYNEIKKYIELCECKVPYRYLLDLNVSFKEDLTYSYLFKSIDDFSNIIELLNFIVLAARNIIFTENKYLSKVPYKKSFESLDLSGMCYQCSSAVKLICDNLKIKNEIIRIDPGFNDKLKLMDGYGYHYFNILTINNKKYLLDLSYIQFFDINGCLLEKMGIYQRYGSYPGIYMMMNDDRKKLSKTLITNGWIELNENNMKHYFDGFALSNRNALYYENLGYIDFSTNYTANDYESFIYGDDNQANREGIDNLGIQRVFIKNPKIEFKTDKSLLKG